MDNFDSAFEKAGFSIESSDDTYLKLKKETEGKNIAVNESTKETVISNSFVTELTEIDREQAVRESVVPKNYKGATFDLEKIKTNIKNQYIKTGRIYKIHKFNDYVGICQSLLTAFRMKKLPQRSYLIGAPNGFGKTSFVMESLITLRKQGFVVAPYISLWELAQIRVENELRISKKMGKYRINSDNKTELVPMVDNNIPIKTPIVVQNAYSFSEYINADCLFVYFSDISSKEIESSMLYQLLQIRGAKGLPTIVMMSSSLEPYTNDTALKEYIWNEIIDFDENSRSLDRVYHISCYKFKSTSVDSRGEKFEAATGIVD